MSNGKLPDGWVDFDDVLREESANRTPAQQAAYEQAVSDATARMDFAELAYRMRKDAGLTQQELAARIGVKQPVISGIERGLRNPTFPTLFRIAEATGNRIVVNVEPV
jgi:ribosome-binding protein aMBF1 (putative translation factor)